MRWCVRGDERKRVQNSHGYEAFHPFAQIYANIIRRRYEPEQERGRAMRERRPDHEETQRNGSDAGRQAPMFERCYSEAWQDIEQRQNDEAPMICRSEEEEC